MMHALTRWLVRLFRVGFSVGLGVGLLACQSDDIQTRWGTYQEPVAQLDLPEAVGLSELRVLWKKNLGAGADDGYAILKPAYGGDGVYAASRSGSVFKLAPETGATIWRRDLGAAIFAGVGAGAHELATVALDNGTVVALAAQSGEVVWESAINRQISTIPVVGAGRVIARTAGGLIIGLDARAGNVVWSFARPVPDLSIHGDSVPVISGDLVFVGLANGKLVANDVRTGREYWETAVSFARGRNELERLTDSDTPPLVSETTVYTATYQGNVSALQVQDAAAKWRTKISSRLPMSLGARRLLVTNELGEVVALDAKTGTIDWTQESFRGRGMSRPLVVEGRVVVGDSQGNVYVLSLKDGTLLQNIKVVNGAVVALIPATGQRSKHFVVFSSEGDIGALILERTPES